MSLAGHMKEAVLERVTRPYRRRQLAAAAGGEGLRLNIGAGGSWIGGWLNTDVSRASPYYLDAARPWPLQPGSAAYVYADNMIEHVPLADARAILANAYVALQSGGTLRIATPDIEGTARLYLDLASRGTEHLERHRRHGYRVDHRVDLLNLTYLESGHCSGYLYDLAALEAELHAAGFVDVRRCAAGESHDPVLRNLEERTDPTDDLASLIVEATRP